jgi:hypothetical protein
MLADLPLQILHFDSAVVELPDQVANLVVHAESGF